MYVKVYLLTILIYRYCLLLFPFSLSSNTCIGCLEEITIKRRLCTLLYVLYNIFSFVQ